MKTPPLLIQSVSELHRLSGLAKPRHPLITLIRHDAEMSADGLDGGLVSLQLYNITMKRGFAGRMQYGRTHYDFEEGSLSFMAPAQVFRIDDETVRSKDGWSLLFHPDLIRQYPLGSVIRAYGFFSYSATEALHLSEEEEGIMEGIIQNIEREMEARLDAHSQAVLVSNLELLLSYCNRFYDRQAFSRRPLNNDLLAKFEALLDTYFAQDSRAVLPTVEGLASDLQVSPAYLSDALRNLTHQNTQQHIHDRLIERAKEILTTTGRSVSEIAYDLGFQYPQSFSKLFKKRVGQTPVAYR